MQKGENFNHPAKGCSTRVEPIRDMGKIRAIENSLFGNPRNLALFTIGIHTWLQPGELLDIRAGQVQHLNPGDEMDVKVFKTGTVRKIQLNKACIDAVQNLIIDMKKKQDKDLEPDERLFTGQRGGLSVSSLNNLVKKWCAEVYLKENCGGQTLRKTYGYRQLIHRGLGLKDLMNEFNHTTSLQTLKYLCVQPGELKNIETKSTAQTLKVSHEGNEETVASLKKEIAELKQTMEKYRESEEKFKTLFEYANDSLIYMDNTGHIVEANDVTEDIFGWSRKEARGKHYSDFLLFKQDYFEDDAFHSFVTSASNIPREINEFEVFRKDRTSIYIEVSTKLVKKKGEAKGIINIVRDVTDRKQMEKALQESEEMARALLNATSDAVMLLDLNGTILDTNMAYAEIFGRQIDEAIGLCLWDMVPPDFHGLKETLARAIETGSSIRLEKEYQGVWMDTMLYPILDSQGNVSRLAVFSQDITKRKEAEETLLRHRDHLEELVKDRTINLEQANTALKVLLKRREEDKTELEEKMVLNVKELALPFLEELKQSGLTTRQNAISQILEHHLNDIISPFVKTLSSKFYNFTPVEIRIANLIKQGKSTKEIAVHFNLSSRTIDQHRYNIRKKLGINNEKANLATHLLSME